MLDGSELQTGGLPEARQYDGRTLEVVEVVENVSEHWPGGGGLQPWQHDGQLGPGGLEDLQDDGEVGDEPQRVEAVEDRVSGEQQSDGVEVVEVVEVVELHGVP